MIPTYYYLTACIIFIAIMFLMILFRPDLRKKILLAAVFALPLGFWGYYFNLSYWNVPILFDLSLGIEDFLIIFGNAGVIAGIYEFVLKKRLVKIKNYADKGFLFVAALLPAWFITLSVLNIFFRFNVMYKGFIVIVMGMVVLCVFRRDLFLPSLYAGLIFCGFYFLLFLLSLVLIPGIVQEGWLLSNLSGALVFGVPIEELGYAFLFGIMWSHLYEAVLGYRIKK